MLRELLRITYGNRESKRPHLLLLRWRLPVRLVLRNRLVLLRRRVPVRRGLVRRLVLLRRGRPVVLRGRGPIRSGRATVAPGGGRPVPLLVRGRAATADAAAAAATATATAAAEAVTVVVLDHHLDVALGVVGGLAHPREGDTPSRGVRSGVNLGRDLDATSRAVL